MAFYTTNAFLVKNHSFNDKPNDGATPGGNHMKITQKRLLSLLLAVATVLSMFPAGALNAQAAAKKATYVAIGDSITADLFGADGRVKGNYATILADRKGYELNTSGLVADPEYTAADVLERIQKDAKTQTAVANADLVTIMLGVNDMMDVVYQAMAKQYNTSASEKITKEDVATILNDSGDSRRISLLMSSWSLLNPENANYPINSKEFKDAVKAFGENIKSIVDLVRSHNPGVTVVVATMYDPFTEYNGAQMIIDLTPLYLCMEAGLSQLNQVIKDNARACGYVVADVKKACDRVHSERNDLYKADPNSLSWDILPTDAGSKVIADAFAAVTPVAPKYYTVSFNGNGGAGQMEAVTVKENYGLPASGFVAPKGYEFAGWAKSANGPVISGSSIFLTDNTTLYAIWEPAVLTGTVEISGVMQIGQMLTATVTGTNNTGDFAYQWYRGRNPISGATNQTYTLVAADQKKSISCKVTSSVQVGTIQANAPGTVQPLPLSGTVTVDGTPQVGNVLTVKISDTNNTGLISYQWYRGDTPVSGAVSSKYTLTDQDLGYTIYCRVVSSVQLGSIRSEATAPVQAPVLSGTVTISGDLQVGSVLTATVSDTNNTGTLSYQWYRGDTPIPGATGNTYQLTSEDQKKSVFCKVTSSAQAGSIRSEATAVIQPLTLSGTVTISGTPEIGQKLTATVADTNNTGNLSYQWYRGDAAIAGAIGTTYVLTDKDLGSTIFCMVTSSVQPGSIRSAATALVQAQKLSGTVTISGTIQVGQILTATVSDTNSSGTLFYQWYRGNTAISDATANTYQVSAADQKQTLSCRVTSSVQTGVIRSEATAPVPPLALTGSVKISGTPQVGQLLTVAVSNSNNTGVLFYQWYRGNTPISGATGADYMLTNQDVGSTVYCQVTSSVQTGSIRSAATAAVLAQNLSGIVKISGSLQVGQVLTAAVVDTNNTGKLSYQWYRGDQVIAGATGNTYKVTAEDQKSVLFCEVSSSVQIGSLWSDATEMVQPLALSGTVKVSGTPQVGQVLTAAVSNTNNTGKLSYQWYRGNTPVSGAVGATYILTNQDLGSTMLCKVTSSVQTGSIQSAATAAVKPQELTGTVTISGSLLVGSVLTATVSDTNNTGTLSYRWYRDKTAIAGATGATYTLTAADEGKTLYCAVTSSVQTGRLVSDVTAVVKPQPFGQEEICFRDYVGTYDGEYHSFDVVECPDDATVKYTVNGTTTTKAPEFKNVGTYTVTYSVSKSGYEAVTGTVQVVIERKAVTVAADAVSIKYGDAEPQLTYKVSGLVSGETLSGKLARDPGSNVGTYAINQGTLTNEKNPNYNITFVGAGFTIRKAVPNYPMLTGLTAKQGQTLADVSLPVGFNWVDPRTTPVGDVGENTFKVVYTPADTVNYETVTLNVTIRVTEKEKLEPAYVVPTGLTAKQGQTLADVKLPDGFSWVDPETTSVGNVGDNTFPVLFTPKDTENYKTVILNVTVTVTPKEKLEPSYDVPTGLTAKQGQTLADVKLPDGFSWVDPVTTSVGDVGNNIFTVVFTPADTENYKTVRLDVTVVVVPKEKLEPTYTVPTGLTATYGQTLADVALPFGFSWKQPGTTSVGEVGDNTFVVVFTPDDTETYKTVELNVTVTVVPGDKLEPTYDVPTGLIAKQGQTLADVKLPAGFSWVDPETTPVGNVGANTFEALFTPEDTETYKTVVVDVTVTVVPKEKLEPTYAVPTGLTAKQGQTLADIILPVGFSWQLPGSTPVGDVGINTFVVIYTPEDTENYKTVSLDVLVTVIPANKQEPNYTVPTGLMAKQGQTLADVKLPDGFSWVDPLTTSVGNVGLNTFRVVFTPADTETYKTVELEVSISVTDKDKLDPTFTIPTGLTAKQGQTLADVKLPAGFSWVDSEKTPVGNAGVNLFKVVYTPEDTETYNTVMLEVSIAVAKNGKQDPVYTVPTGLTAKYGQILAEVKLPAGFSWIDPSASVGAMGTNSFKALYTPADTKNYNTATLYIAVTVLVDAYSVQVLDSNLGSVTGTGVYEAGKKVTLSAKPASGSKFLYWVDASVPVDGTLTQEELSAAIISKTPDYSFDIDRDVHLQAVFVSAEIEIIPMLITGTNTESLKNAKRLNTKQDFGGVAPDQLQVALNSSDLKKEFTEGEKRYKLAGFIVSGYDQNTGTKVVQLADKLSLGDMPLYGSVEYKQWLTPVSGGIYAAYVEDTSVTGEGNSKNPGTGDNSDLVIWLVILLFCVGGLAILSVTGRKKRKK